MNYLEEYIAIIHNRQQNPLPEGQYGEKHHVIPKSCGGCNAKWNLVKLTPEEHYRCHYLLTFIYATGKEHASMVYAWNQISGRVDGDFMTPEEYTRLRKEHSKLVSDNLTGISFTEDHKEKISKALKGHPGWNKGGHRSEEDRKKISEALKRNPPRGMLGKHPSEEWRRQQSERTRQQWAKRRLQQQASGSNS